MEIAFSEWAEGILSGLSDAQLQHMMNTEFGGMNEIMVDLYADTGDERWLDLSYKFEHRAFIEPLQHHQDNLAGKHGNTAVPKLIGSADRFALTGNPADLMAASFFWDRVVQNHSFSSGGHGKDEYFGPSDQLSDRIDGRTAELPGSADLHGLLPRSVHEAAERQGMSGRARRRLRAGRVPAGRRHAGVDGHAGLRGRL